MKLGSKAVLLPLLAVLFLLSGVAWCRTPIRDGDPGTIGACLMQPDGSRVTLPCEEVIRCGRSGKSFAIKEWFEPQPAKPRLAVVSTRPLPVKEYWNVDVTGILSTFSGVSRDGSEIRQRVLIVCPENVTVYCSRNGKAVPFMPIKGLDMDWPCKRSLADLACEDSAETASVSVMSEGDLPPMPDGLDSESPPIYCATIAEARAAYDPNNRVLVELQCRPFSGATSTQFTLGQDSPTDSIAAYYTNSGSLGTGRINKIVGTIQKDTGTNYWIEVDSGPNWQEGDDVGGVQSVAEGTLAWAKTFADQSGTDHLPAPLNGKVVSRAVPQLNCIYLQEEDRSSDIRVEGQAVPYTTQPGDVISIPAASAQLGTTSDGERVINLLDAVTMETPVDPPKPLGVNNRDSGGGEFNVYTPGPAGGCGLNNIGLLMRVWGRVTSVSPTYFYIDDGSNINNGIDEPVGIRVESGARYTPTVGDYVAVTGISALRTLASAPARVFRMISGSDFTPITPPRPDFVQAVATGDDQNGMGTITVFWSAVPGATGYYVYRGTEPGGEDYENPLNSTPITLPTYQGSTMFSYTDTGLTNYYQECFYTVKAVSATGTSEPSDEASAIPYSEAIPWASRDVGLITNAVRNRILVSGDYFYIRACGPDGTIYDSFESQPITNEFTLVPGTNLLQRNSNGEIIPLPQEPEESGSGGTQSLLEVKTLPPSDGPYRRVTSKLDAENHYFGSTGYFYLPDVNSIHLNRSDENKDTPYIYLGSDYSTRIGIRANVDAGLMWSTPSGGAWAPILFSSNCGQWSKGDYLANIGLGSRFAQGSSAYLSYFIDYDESLLVVQGISEYLELGWVAILSNFYCGGPLAKMKRNQTIAQGHPKSGPDRYRLTGSYFLNGDVTGMYFLQDNGPGNNPSWVPCAPARIGEDGSYPARGSIVDWDEDPNYPYWAEHDIDIHL